jgi:integrase
VVRGKGRREDRLPLPSDVGEAIAAYLKQGRQNSTAHREVFLRTVAPVGPLGTNGISGIVRCACVRAGVPVIRAHRLRHTLACQLEISDVATTASLDMVRDQGPIRDLGFSAVSSAGVTAPSIPRSGRPSTN